MSEIVDARSDREAAVARAVAALRGGHIVVLPTDTVYGVAADDFDHERTARIFRATARSRSLPLPVLVRSPKQLMGLVTRVPAEAERLMAAYWPGELTIVVRSDPNLTWDLGDADGTVAVRMPFDEVTLDVIRAVGPLAVTSANRSGLDPARTAAEAEVQLGEQVLVYVDDGPRESGAPSTIVDLTRREPHVLREGGIPGDEALAVARGEIAPHEIAPPPASDDLA